jgi:hypothetical protein
MEVADTRKAEESQEHWGGLKLQNLPASIFFLPAQRHLDGQPRRAFQGTLLETEREKGE